jgi:hypothetical protein
MPRNANWHETGGNAKQLKGSEEDALAEHAPPPLPSTKSGRGAVKGGQPSHVEALYPKGISRRRTK